MHPESWLQQFEGGTCSTPVRWSPSASLLCLFHQASSLHVLNTRLETVWAWPEGPPQGSGSLQMAFDWTPSSALMAAVHDPAPLYRCFQLHAVCDSAQPASSESEVAMANKVLAELSPREMVKHLACSPISGVAFVTEVEHWPRNYSHKLHVVLPGSLPASVAVDHHYHASEAAVVWSPAGDRLLVTNSYMVQLVTSACVLLLHIEECYDACFSPSGRHLAAAFSAYSRKKSRLCVRLFSTSRGEVAFDQEWDGGIFEGSLAFNYAGDQLLLALPHGARAVTFGQAYEGTTMSSRQVCDAIAGAITCTNILGVDEDEDDDEDDWY